MAARGWPSGATSQLCSTDDESADSSFPRLPSPLLELVLQHLSLAQQLNHCSHLCYRLPPPTANSLCYAPLLLNDGVVRRLSQSPRLFGLLSAATSVTLHVDGAPGAATALQLVVSSTNLELLFPQLASFTFELSRQAMDDEVKRRTRQAAMEGLRWPYQGPLSLAPLVPFLSARSATLRFLRIDHSASRPLLSGLDSLLRPLRSLRRLYIATLLSMDIVAPLLHLPLDVLDLSRSELIWQTHDEYEPAVADLAGCALLQSCCVLRLPKLEGPWAPPLWMAYLDAIVTARTGNTRPHTLSVHHAVSAAATEQLLVSPPCRSLTIAVPREIVSSESAAAHQFMADGKAPRQLRLSISCDQWADQSAMQRLVDFVQLCQSHVGSMTLKMLPYVGHVTSQLLSAISHCTKLETLSLSASQNNPPRALWPDDHSTQTRWPERPRLSQLQSLTLAGLKGAEDGVCWLLSACPSLRVCRLDLAYLTLDMLRILASSSPLLSHLQLQVSVTSVLASTIETDEERPRPAILFRSLVHFDLYVHGTQSRTQKRPPAFPAIIRRLTLRQPTTPAAAYPASRAPLSARPGPIAAGTAEAGETAGDDR